MSDVKQQQEALKLTLDNLEKVEWLEKSKLENTERQIKLTRISIENIKDSYYLATNILQTINDLEKDIQDKLINLQKALANALYSTWYPSPSVTLQETIPSHVEEVISEAVATKSEPQPAA